MSARTTVTMAMRCPGLIEQLWYRRLGFPLIGASS